MKTGEGDAELRIDPQFTFVKSAEGNRIDLTRSERRALMLMVSHPNRLLTRDDLLDAVSEPGSGKRDRNIDFLVNRLRRKLGDDARRPRYIATRYGEGYVWIGAVAPVEPDVASAYLVVGPVVGLDALPESQATGQGFGRALAHAFSALLGEGRRVVYAPDCPSAETLGIASPRFSAGLVFFRDRGECKCVVGMRDFSSGRPLSARRLSQEDLAHGAVFAARVARSLVDQLWLATATRPGHGAPLPVALYAAEVGDEVALKGQAETSGRRSLSLVEASEARSLSAWKKNDSRLRAMLDENPADPQLKLLLAVNIHTKYLMAGSRLFAAGVDERKTDEDAIEELVTEALPGVSADPDCAVVAGKLLHFLKRGYDDLGRDLCEDAHARSTSVSRSLAIVGQMRAFHGETNAAIESLDQALSLSRRGSHAHAYALFIKAQALAAVGAWDELAALRKDFSRISPIGGLFMELLFCDPYRPSLRGRALVRLFSRDRVRAQLLYTHYLSARLFSDPEHGANALRPFSRLAMGRFAAGAFPAEVRAAYPGLLLPQANDRFSASCGKPTQSH